MSNELAVRSTDIIQSFDDVSRIGKAMAASGYFRDASDAAKAIVKIMAGHEMGFGPFASMTGVHVIQGKPAIGANLMGAAVKSDPRYDYRVTKMNDDLVEITFYEHGDVIGVSSFSMNDANKAGLAGKDNWRKYPRNMLFARAMSNGVRFYCPDIYGGNAVYTPDELGAEVDESGDVINGQIIEPPEEHIEEVEEAPAEPEPDPAKNGGDRPTPSPKRTRKPAQPSSNGGVSWPAQYITPVISEGLTENPHSAMQTIKKCNLHPNDCAPDDVVAWFEVYRTARDNGADSDEAAQIANEQAAQE